MTYSFFNSWNNLSGRLKMKKREKQIKIFFLILLPLLLIVLKGSPALGYSWSIGDLFREKMKEDFLVGSIWYQAEYQGRDNAITHFFNDFQYAAADFIHHAGLIIPLLPNETIEHTHFQARLFTLSSVGNFYPWDIMPGLQLSFGNWYYYYTNDASAVMGTSFAEIAFGYVFSFNIPEVQSDHLDASYEQDEESHFYIELNSPYLNLISFYKVFTNVEELLTIISAGISFMAQRSFITDIFDFDPGEIHTVISNLMIVSDILSGKEVVLNFDFEGLFNYLNLYADVHTDLGLIYAAIEFDHLFLFRGDFKGEEAYFSKKYAPGFRLKFNIGYYDPLKDYLVDFYAQPGFENYPITAGIDIAFQLPFWLVFDALLFTAGTAMVIGAIVADILAIVYEASADSFFFLTIGAIYLEGLLIEYMVYRYENDSWKENYAWSSLELGVHYNDRLSIIENPFQLEQNNRIFFYGKINTFF